MVKIRHDRPSLLFSDNFRRELARAASLRGQISDGCSEVVLSRVEREDALANHKLKYKDFDPQTQSVIEAFLKNYERVQKSKQPLRLFIDLRRRKKDAYQIDEDLISSGAYLLHEVFFRTEYVNDQLWDWLNGFLPLLGNSDARDWSKLLKLIVNEGFPLALARRVGNTPGEVEQLRIWISDNLTEF